MTPTISFDATRLCSACGLCCNGVMFRLVQLQPSDSAKALAALGLKLKRKNRRCHILQPCPAYSDSQCSIYHDRPLRCRLFECRQFKRVAAGEITEGQALEKIREALQQVERVKKLLRRAGAADEKRRLSKNVEKLMAEPLDATSSPAALQLRHELTEAMRELNALLDQDFKLDPAEINEAA